MEVQPCASCQFSGYPEQFPEWRRNLGALVIAVKLILIVFGVPLLWSARRSTYVSIRQPALSLIFACGALFNLHIPLRELLGEGRVPCVVFLAGTYMFVPTFGFGLALRFLRIRVLHRMQNRVRRLMEVKKELPPLPGTNEPDFDILTGRAGDGTVNAGPGGVQDDGPPPTLSRTQQTEAAMMEEAVKGDVVQHMEVEDEAVGGASDTELQALSEGEDETAAAADQEAQVDQHAVQPQHGRYNSARGNPARTSEAPVAATSAVHVASVGAAGRGAGREGGAKEAGPMLSGPAISRVEAPSERKRRRCKLPPLHSQRAQLQAVAIFIAFCLCQLTIRLLAFGDAADVSDLTSLKYGCIYNGFDYFWLLSFCLWFLFVLVAVLLAVRTQDDDFGLKSELYIVVQTAMTWGLCVSSGGS